MLYVETAPAAVVMAQDIAAVAALAAEPADHHDRLMYVLFGPAPSAARPRLRPYDHGAVGTLLTYRAGLQEDEGRMLAVAHAAGRARVDRWRLEVGVVLLAGEIAARSVHRLLAGRFGPEGFEALSDAIALCWPLPDEQPEPQLPGHPGMNLGRMLKGPARPVMENWQVNMARVLATAFSSHDDNDQVVRSTARCAGSAHTQLMRRHAEITMQVRREVIDVRYGGGGRHSPLHRGKESPA